jgi:hypothetical protein
VNTNFDLNRRASARPYLGAVEILIAFFDLFYRVKAVTRQFRTSHDRLNAAREDGDTGPRHGAPVLDPKKFVICSAPVNL